MVYIQIKAIYKVTKITTINTNAICEILKKSLRITIANERRRRKKKVFVRGRFGY